MTLNSYKTKKVEGSDKENDTVSSFNTIDSCAPQREKARRKRGVKVMGDVSKHTSKRRKSAADAGGVQCVVERDGRNSVEVSTTSSYSLPFLVCDGGSLLGDGLQDDERLQDGRLQEEYLQDEQLQDLQDFQQLQDLSPLSPGTHLSQYRILRILGHGNFSTTYLAETTPTEPEPPDNPRHLVAIKRLKSSLSSIGENEYSLLEFLHSREPLRHVISPITSFFSDSHFHLVLEPLDSARPVALPACDCGHPPLACPGRHLTLAKVMLQLLSGLLSLHSHNLIHADLTPANILFLPESNRIKLIDLGNTIRPEDREAYLDDYGVQSACYRAPEILLGAGPLSRVMDVWSAGVIAVEMLVGRDVVGDGLEGGELLRGAVEGREGMVERVVELVGSVREYQGGIYWQDVYDEISLEPVKKKRKLRGRKRQPEQRMEKAGMLKQFLEAEATDIGLVGFLMAMMEVGVSRRSTAMEMLRHPWLVRKLLGDWGHVLAGEIEEVESVQDQSEIVALEAEEEEEEGEQTEVDEDVTLPLLNEPEDEIDDFFGAPNHRDAREQLVDIREQSTDVLEANMEPPKSSPPIECPITPLKPSLLQNIQDTPLPPSPSLAPTVRDTSPYPSSPLLGAITSTPPPYHPSWHNLTELTPSRQDIKTEAFSSPIADTFDFEDQAYKEDTDNSAPETSLFTGEDITTRIFARENLLSSPPSSPFVPQLGADRGGYRSSESRSPSPVAMVGASNYGKEESLFEKEGMEEGRRVSDLWDRDLAADMDSMSDEGANDDEVMLC